MDTKKRGPGRPPKTPLLKAGSFFSLGPIIDTAPKVDMVNHPPHYKAGGIETIDFIEAKELGFNLGNAVKYITRSELKGTKVEDLRKAVWYLEREIAASLKRKYQKGE
jgi:hypothetical protein